MIKTDNFQVVDSINYAFINFAIQLGQAKTKQATLINL